MEILILMSVTTGIALFTFLIVLISSKLIGSYYKRKDKKMRQMFPKLYELSSEIDEKTDEISNYQRQIIDPLKFQIDRLLKKYQYLPRERRIEVDEKIEDLRFKHYTASIRIKEMKEEKKNLKKEFNDYLKINNIDWYKNGM